LDLLNNLKMKKRYFLMLGMILLMSNSLWAQDKVDVKETGLYRHNQMKYVFAMKYHDWRMAASALYDLIAMDPADDSVKLNLGYLYYQNNSFPSALFISTDLLSRMPQNEKALELNAVCYENMGLKDKAISAYESLYLINNDLNVLFNTTALQYETGRKTEALTNAKIISENPKSKEIKLTYPKGENETQEISLDAASINLMGMIEKDNGNKEQAKEYFNKALSIAPDFELAKNQLKELE